MTARERLLPQTTTHIPITPAATRLPLPFALLLMLANTAYALAFAAATQLPIDSTEITII
jgi:hypothetical protein